jgi:hypothetical protein
MAINKTQVISVKITFIFSVVKKYFRSIKVGGCALDLWATNLIIRKEGESFYAILSCLSTLSRHGSFRSNVSGAVFCCEDNMERSGESGGPPLM